MKPKAAIGSWLQRLQELPPTLAQAIGPWLPRLAALSGPIAWLSSEPDGDPDGYGDLSQRGSYERLLSSEWALAQAQPREFIRRAAMGEHLFLQLQRRRFQHGRRISVLFDAGPDQLGNPRLVHLAWLLVLAARAQRAGAEFRWGTLQEEDWAGDDAQEQDFQRLLHGRSRRTGYSQAGRWLESLGAAETGEERWWIGGRELAQALGPADHVGIVVEPWQQREITYLEASLRSGPGQAQRSCQLTLPEHRVRRLLLRGQLSRIPQIEAQHPAAKGDLLAFSPAGDRLIFAVGHDRLTARHLPRSRTADAGNPRWFELADTEVLIAVGFTGRRFVTVTHEDESLRFRGAGTKSQRRDNEYLEVEIPPEMVIPEVGFAAGPCFLTRGRSGGKTDVCFLDAAGQLFVFEPQPGRVFCLAGRATAVCEWQGRLFAVLGDEDPLPHEVPPGGIVCRPGNRLECLDVAEHVGGQAFFGWRHKSGAKFPLIAVEREPGIFRFVDRKTELRNSMVGTVVGVGEGPNGQPGLLLLEEDRRTVQHIGLRFHRRLFRSPVAIRQITTSITRPIWGALLEDGTVRVHSLRSDRALFVSEVKS